jgi:hypothetical protein
MGPNKPKSNNIIGLLDQLGFSPDNTIEAAATNPLLFKLAADYRIECLEKRNNAKMEMETAKATAELEIRKDARQTGNKITEGHIDALLLVDKTVSKLVTAFNRAEERDEYAKLIVEAFRMRRDSLKVVGDLVRGELSSAQAIETANQNVAATREKLRAKFPKG